MHFPGFAFSVVWRLPAKTLTWRSAPPRFFSVSPHRRAAEIPQSQREALEALRNSQTFRKISKSPAALSAIQKLAELMQNSGIDAGTRPTTLQMLKLAANSEFRETSKNVVQEFKNAGIDLNSANVLEELQSIAKALVTTPKS